MITKLSCNYFFENFRQKREIGYILSDHSSLLSITTPRYLQVRTVSNSPSSMQTDWHGVLDLLKFTTSSLVLVVFRSKQLFLVQPLKDSTTSLYFSCPLCTHAIWYRYGILYEYQKKEQRVLYFNVFIDLSHRVQGLKKKKDYMPWYNSLSELTFGKTLDNCWRFKKKIERMNIFAFIAYFLYGDAQLPNSLHRYMYCNISC